MARTSKPKHIIPPVFVKEWDLPAAATLGSSVRAKGILLEIRAKLPATAKKLVDVRGSTLVLGLPEGEEEQFQALSTKIGKALVGIEDLPIIPREIEDILTIKTSERHRWLKDGRLPSAGTRTVKLRGRAKKITFHVFDPRKIEELLDSDMVTIWREEDMATAAENRRKAAWNRRLAKAQAAEQEKPGAMEEGETPKLAGWEAFMKEGLLR